MSSTATATLTLTTTILSSNSSEGTATLRCPFTVTVEEQSDMTPLHGLYWEDLPKTPGDSNSYRMVKLQSGAQAILVSNPSIKCTAAALLVETGSLNDPEDVQGIAHLTEHCVTRYIEAQVVTATGSSANPQTFSQYTRRHRGGVFAEVSGDYSLYYFQVATEAFGTAMKTFSKAITQVPFLDPEIVGREVLRVHAEFHNNRQKDSQCIRFLNTYLTRSDMHTSPRFFDGDYSSLVDHFDGVKPATCPPNPLNPADHDMWVSVRDRVIGWWELHYPQSRRFLAISGPGSVEELHAIVDASFATDGIPPVPHTGTVPRTPRLQLPFSWDSEHSFIHMQTPQGSMGLHVLWVIPSTGSSFDNIAVSVLSHALSDSGSSTLRATLRERGWLTDLTVLSDPGDARDGYRYLCVAIGLTGSGWQRWCSVLVLVQAYITLLRTRGLAPQVIDNAVQVAKNISFRRRLDSLEISRESTFMLKGTPKKTVFLTAHWDFPELTSDSFLEWVLRFISPNNIRVILATPAQWENPMMAGEGWKTLPKYDIKYTVGSLNTRISGFPRQPFQATDVGDIELQLPQTNPFVPWDLKVLAGFDEITTGYIFRRGLFFVYRKDNIFADPRVCVSVVIDSPSTVELHEHIYFHLYMSTVLTRLQNTFDMAAAAGSTCVWKLERDVDGVVLQITTYPEKLLQILGLVWDTIFGSIREVDETCLTSSVALLRGFAEIEIRSLFGALNHEHHACRRSRLRALLSRRSFSPRRKLAALEDIDLQAVKSYAKRLADGEVNVKFGLYGNIEPAMVDAVVDLASSGLKIPLKTDPWIDLPNGNLVIEVTETRPNNLMNEVYYCCRVGKHTQALLRLVFTIAHLMDYSDILLEYDLGYETEVTYEVGGGYLWLTVYARTLRDPAFVERAIDDFLLRVQAIYENTPPTELAAELEDRNEPAGAEQLPGFDEANEQMQRYVMRDAEPSITKGRQEDYPDVDLSIDEIVSCYRTMLSAASPSRSKLSLRLCSSPRLLSMDARQMVIDELSARGVKVSATMLDTLQPYGPTSMTDIIERIQAEVSQSTPVVDIKGIVRRAAEKYPIEDPATGSASEDLAALPAAPMIFVESIEELRTEVARRAEEVRAVEPKYKKKSCHYPML